MLCCLPMAAQLNGTGFYRFRNAQNTSDYISLTNNMFDYYTIIAEACGGGSNLVDTSNPLALLLGNVTFKADGVARCLSCACAYLSTDIHMVEDSDIINPASVVYATKRYPTQRKPSGY